MGNKIITDEGKTELLRLGFTDGDHKSFSYLALGSGESEAAQGGEWKEVSNNNYSRVPTTLESDIIQDGKEIVISGIFKEENYSVAGDGGVISEIGLCNSATTSNEETFFLYSEVPEIAKTDNISLKYTIIISIE